MIPEVDAHLKTEAHVLAVRLGFQRPVLIAKGTEAYVYALDNKRVLKLYPSPESLSKIRRLQEFYQRVAAADVCFAIPRILQYGETESVVFSIEDRLLGVRMADIADFTHNTRMIEMYIDAFLSIRNISVSPPFLRRKLFDADGDSLSWSDYLREGLLRKYSALRENLTDELFAQLGSGDALADYLVSAYSGPDLLIHGDYHPGNVLVVNESQVSAVVDFGTFTMFGDPLFDVGTACGFFSMYEPDQIATRKRVLARVLQKDSTLDPVRVHAYLLAAAIMTCDMYPEEGVPVYKTGHFDWALTVLQDPEMWIGISD